MKSKVLKNVIQKSLEENNFRHCHVDFTGKQKISEGHLSEISFVDVSYEIDNGEKEILHLAIKTSKETEAVKDMMIRIFNQETLFYQTIFPIFVEFQIHRNVESVFNPLVKFYKTVVTDTVQVIILENVKAKGFELKDRRKPLTLQHLRLALEYYSKFHALSFAVNDQQPELLKVLNNNVNEVLNKHLGILATFIPIVFEHTLDMLLRRGESELHATFKKILNGRNLVHQVLDLHKEDTNYLIISHCDPWVNNFMFLHKVSTFFLV